MLIKLDMRKVYDRLKWCFVDIVLYFVQKYFLLLSKKEDERILNGIKISRGAPTINHLMYEDDLMIFAWLILRMLK